MIAAQHISIGHAWHGLAIIAFAPPIAGRVHAHQAGILPVLHIAFQNTVFDKHGFGGRRAFIINGQRAAAVGYCAVINHRDAGRSDALANTVRKGRGFFAVEIAFQAVADRFMQQNAGPARPQHHIHFTGRCGNAVEIGDRLFERIIDLLLPVLRRQPLRIIGPSAAP